MRHKRILIVDDSAVMRSLLRSVILSDPALEVAGTAADGRSALQLVEILQPDLILLDVEMPVMDGVATLRELRSRKCPGPVIMCSSLTQRGAKVTIEALACGAADYVAKPVAQSDRETAFRVLSNDLLSKIHALTGPMPPPPAAAPAIHLPLLLPSAVTVKPHAVSTAPAVVVIGVSTGGPAALEVLLPALPADFPLPVLIVQHMPELFTVQLAERLDNCCLLSVREAAEGSPARTGCIYIARGNWHLELTPAASASAPPTLHLGQGQLENHCRPSADVLFRSAARTCGAGVVAVVLTGMGSDGMNGCRAIRETGGMVLAQDQASSTVWGMPGAVVAAGLAQRVLPLAAIAPELIRIAARSGEAYRMAVQT